MEFSPILRHHEKCDWAPLFSQQIRLRNIFEIFGFNFHSNMPRSLYFTLHLTPMSAPFFTSEYSDEVGPKWRDLGQKNIPNSSISGLVLRIWQHLSSGEDSIVATYGVYLSGLVYLGTKLSDLKEEYFERNTIIFSMSGGFFTFLQNMKQDIFSSINRTNIVGDSDSKKIYRCTVIQVPCCEVQSTYNLEKLRKLHHLQVSIKNVKSDVQIFKTNLNCKYFCDTNEEKVLPTSPSKVRYAPQLLTMNCLNKMLQVHPTKSQKNEIIKLSKNIESVRFKCKLLCQEKHYKAALIRQLKQKLVNIFTQNSEKSTLLRDRFCKLNGEIDDFVKIKDNNRLYRQLFLSTHIQLQQRRRQLMQELLFIYPIDVFNNKYTINHVYLPNSDQLTDFVDVDVSVALGYIAHVLIMCSSITQVPLRYPITHYGSRSYISDYISTVLSNKERDFPLFTKGKEKIHFTYAVYLLNKNIAQMRWIYFLNTPELKATLPNLLNLLHKEDTKYPVIENLEKKWESCNLLTSPSASLEIPKISKTFSDNENMKEDDNLNEVISVPEAFLSNEMTSESFKTYMKERRK